MAAAESALVAAPVAPVVMPPASEGPPTARRPVGQTIARGALALVSTQPLTWTATLLTTVFLPRFLGDGGLGLYAMVLTLSSLVGTVATLGLPELLTRRTAAQPRHASRDGTAALLIVGCTSTLLSVALFSAARALGDGHLLPQPLLLAGLAGAAVGAAQRVVFALLIGQERHGRFAWLNATGVAGSAVAGVTALALGAGITAFVLITNAVGLVVTLVGWVSGGFRLRRDALDRGLLRELATGGAPFLLWSAAMRVRAEIDVLLVAVLLRPEAAGWLAAAYRVISIPVFIPTLVTTPLLPALTRARGDTPEFRETVHRSVAAVLLLTVPCAAGIFALAPAVPNVLGWGEAFAPSVPLMMLLAIQQPLVALDMVLGTALIALTFERRWLRVGLAAAIFSPTGNLLLVPLVERFSGNGAIGAALVEVATELLMLCGALWLLPRGMVGRRTFSLAGRIATAGCCAAAAGAWLLPVALPLAVLVCPGTFVISLVALRVARPSDARRLGELARSALRPRPA